MDVAELKHLLAKPATTFTAGGFTPTHADEESWLGQVSLYRPDESIPLDETGAPMLPLAQFHLPSLPFNSPLLKDTRILTAFMSSEFPQPFEPMGRNWVIREYGHDEPLERKALVAANSHLKPHALQAEFLEADFPLWDSEDMPMALAAEIQRLEDSGEIDEYYDTFETTSDHKVGGYPSYCQSGIDPGDGYEFVFQVSSDPTINLEVVDSGSLMFWKHRDTGEWLFYYDFC